MITTVKERPIPFKSEMVRAILENRKTMTRRVMKPQPQFFSKTVHIGDGNYWIAPRMKWQQEILPYCPYGQLGDRLWVRENFWIEHDSDSNDTTTFDCGVNLKEDSWANVQYCATPLNPDQSNQAGDWHPENWNLDGPVDDGKNIWVEWQYYSKRSYIFMPRWASRITLEIISVRVERVQDISVEDIKAEGIYPGMQAATENWKVAVIQSDGYQYCQDFKWLWDSINAKRGYSFESNPYVWVIEFKKVETK